MFFYTTREVHNSNCIHRVENAQIKVQSEGWLRDRSYYTNEGGAVLKKSTSRCDQTSQPTANSFIL